ncbi:MAG: RNA 3'-terminal phosphate cyclase [Promethearchaeota archaeon]
MIANYINIDGSFGEGGGAILRLSAGFSVLYHKPIKIINIRANRPKPGLRLQHLLGLQTLSNLTNSELSNCRVGTTELTFNPNNQIQKRIHVNINTAASIALLIQPIQIACMAFRNLDRIEVSLGGGGTFGKWAPSLNYLKHVTFPIFQKCGYKIDIEIKKYGMYPKGDAYTKCIFYPPKDELKSINLTELGNIDRIQGEIIITNHLRRNRDNIVHRIKKSIKQALKRQFPIETTISHEWVESVSPGVGLSLWAESDKGAIISTGTLLGERQISSEKLGEMAANEIIKYIKNKIPVDNYLSDQLIPLMSYIKKPSSIKVLEVTSHTKTNLDLIKKFSNRNHNIIKQNNHYIIQYL